MSDAAPSEAARIVAGKYRLVRLLGSGGMGRVFEAEHVQVRRSFALKFLRQDRVPAVRSLKRFEREAELLGRLAHENIVALLDIGVDDANGPYLVLEYVRGATLRAELDEHGVRPVERVVSIARQLGRGLAHAHAFGIVHRDLKPENVMLAQRADGGLLVKILDFGVAGLCDGDAERMTLSDTTLGTAAYMAPEQARGERTLDARTDVYALGVIVYEALSGTRPHVGSSYNETLFKILHRDHRPLAELRPDLPEALVVAVERALSKQAAARFSSVEELVREVARGVPEGARLDSGIDVAASTVEGELPRFSPERSAWTRWGWAAGLGVGAALGYAAALEGSETSAPATASPPTDRALSAESSAKEALPPKAQTSQPLDHAAPEAPASGREAATRAPLASSIATALATNVRLRPPPAPQTTRTARAEPTQRPTDLGQRGYITENPYADDVQVVSETADD